MGQPEIGNRKLLARELSVKQTTAKQDLLTFSIAKSKVPTELQSLFKGRKISPLKLIILINKCTAKISNLVIFSENLDCTFALSELTERNGLCVHEVAVGSVFDGVRAIDVDAVVGSSSFGRYHVQVEVRICCCAKISIVRLLSKRECTLIL